MTRNRAPRRPMEPWQADVIALVGRGYTNDEIAAELFLAHGAVKSRLARCFRLMGARDRAQALAFAISDGYVVLHPDGRTTVCHDPDRCHRTRHTTFCLELGAPRPLTGTRL